MAMYGEEGSVHGWNAVDVRVDDHLQHGDVINVAPGGLIIDFRCAKQRALFVEFDRVYHSPHSTQHSFQPEKQALLRRYPDGAWIWYTGRVVNMWRFSSDSAQLLDVELPAGAVRQVVHFHQVRTIPSEADWEELRVGNDDFVIRSCQLPAAFLAEGSELRRELFQCRLNYRYQVVCTSVLSQTVVYLQRQNKAPLTADQVDGIFKQVKKEERRRRPRDTAHLQLVLRQRADVANKPRKTSGGAGAASLPLPAELLVEIFQSLDSIGRVRCRRVCPLWNDILTTEAYFPDVRVSAGHPDYGVLTFAGPGIYWAGACLLRCVSSRTKMVIISSVGLYQCVELTALLGMLLEPVKIPLVVFYDCEFGEELSGIRGVMDCAVRTFGEGSACERVVWKKCDMYDRNLKLKAAVAQHAFTALSGDALEGELCDVFEQHLVLTKPLNQPALATSIADCIAHRSSELTEEQIVKALNEYQRVDPRPATHYRIRKWAPAALAGLDASKLTTLTAVVLSEGIEIEDIEDSSSDDSDYSD